VCGIDQGGRFKDSKGRDDATSCKMNQLTCGMADMDGNQNCASRATTSSEGFVFKDLYIKLLLYLVYNNVLILYTFLLCRLK
jgi:hypothetical protein